jgi:hypothetical protein
VLDEWQVFVLERALGVREDGRWAAFEVGLNVPRQNGKGGVLEALELFWLFEMRERLVIHSAHEFATSSEAFARLVARVEDTDDLYGQVKRRGGRVVGIKLSHGEEGIELQDGCRIRFRTRTKGGGRGLTGDKLVLDEAMILPEKAIGALVPTLAARPDAQIVYAGSAVDQLVLDEGVAFARVRERGREGDDPRLAYFEWSALVPDRDDGHPVTPIDVSEEIAESVDAVAESNPALGIRISVEHVEAERRAMAARTFAVERLGVGDWPSTDPEGASIIDLDAWKALVVPESSAIVGQVCFAFDVSPDRSSAAVAVCGLNRDELPQVEVVEHRRGTGWVVGRISELRAKHSPFAVICTGSGITGTLVDELVLAGVDVTSLNATEYAQACAGLVDQVLEERVRHLGSKELRDAIRGAATRPLGDAWAWSRKSSSVDISPLVAATLAVRGVVTATSGEFVVDTAKIMASA